jgi:non-ribosomal peptide synthetase component F
MVRGRMNHPKPASHSAPAFVSPSQPTRMNANLYALLAAHFTENAEQPCLLIPDQPVVHYDELDAASARFAHALTAAGARPGDRVAAQVDKCWEALALYLACLRAGFVYPAAQHGLPEERAHVPFRRCSARGHHLRPAVRRAQRGAAPRGGGADARERQRNAARPGRRPCRRRSTRSHPNPTMSPRFSTRPEPRAAPKARC